MSMNVEGASIERQRVILIFSTSKLLSHAPDIFCNYCAGVITHHYAVRRLGKYRQGAEPRGHQIDLCNRLSDY